MDIFNIVSYFFMALNAEFRVICIYKNRTTTIQVFFFFFINDIYFCLAITSEKHE